MNKKIQAWKNPAFRATLTETEREALENPVGMIELTGTALDQVSGGGASCGSGSGKGSNKGTKKGSNKGTKKGTKKGSKKGSGKGCGC